MTAIHSPYKHLRKLSFPIKNFLTFILIVQTILSLAQEILVDSVNFIVYIWDIKEPNIWTFHQEVSKIVLHIGLNVYRKSSRDFWFVTNSLLMRCKWSQTRPISCTNLIFPVTFIRVSSKQHALLIDWDKGKP